MAQLGSALRSGRRGRGFKSRHPDQTESSGARPWALCLWTAASTGVRLVKSGPTGATSHQRDRATAPSTRSGDLGDWMFRSVSRWVTIRTQGVMFPRRGRRRVSFMAGASPSTLAVELARCAGRAGPFVHVLGRLDNRRATKTCHPDHRLPLHRPTRARVHFAPLSEALEPHLERLNFPNPDNRDGRPRSEVERNEDPREIPPGDGDSVACIHSVEQVVAGRQHGWVEDLRLRVITESATRDRARQARSVSS